MCGPGVREVAAAMHLALVPVIEAGQFGGGLELAPVAAMESVHVLPGYAGSVDFDCRALHSSTFQLTIGTFCGMSWVRFQLQTPQNGCLRLSWKVD